jgi:hypothetical protein
MIIVTVIVMIEIEPVIKTYMIIEQMIKTYMITKK